MNLWTFNFVGHALRGVVAVFMLWSALIPVRSSAACLELAWQDVLVNQSPSGRRGHAMAYDSFRGVTILFGGLDRNDVVLNDTWLFDKHGWKQLQPAHSPPARFRHTLSYDASRGIIVLFGGVSFNGGFLGASFGDVWEWNGTDWRQISVEGEAPAARFWHGMAFDSTRGVHVLFGGYLSQNQEYSDTWEYNGNTRHWTRRETDSPGARRGMSLVFDAGRNQTLLFGGYTSSGANLSDHYLNDTWTWDGLAGIWIRQGPRITPQGRALYSFAYDSVRSVVLMQNGEVVVPNLNTTATVRESWEWDGTEWRNPFARRSGEFCCPRREAALVYELAHQRMIMFGGDGVSPDGTWALEPVPYYQNIVYVNWNTRPGEYPDTYQTVRQGVNAALNCTEIIIYSGDYNETASGSVPLVITKAVRLEPYPQPGQSARIVRIH